MPKIVQMNLWDTEHNLEPFHYVLAILSQIYKKIIRYYSCNYRKKYIIMSISISIDEVTYLFVDIFVLYILKDSF